MLVFKLIDVNQTAPGIENHILVRISRYWNWFCYTVSWDVINLKFQRKAKYLDKAIKTVLFLK